MTPPGSPLFTHVYLAPRLAGGALQIDGNLDKPQWAAAPWSTPFEDIRGIADAPAEAQPRSSCVTRMKMLWDDEYLYVGAILESDFAVTKDANRRQMRCSSVSLALR